jgi:hypothetical protein
VPPRFAYWTILIDSQPTAFRARDQAELLPTLQQLKRTNPNAEMKWFARGKLWDTPEQAQWAGKNLPKPNERRTRDWRPGGDHKDPRARFQKRRDSQRRGESQTSGADRKIGPDRKVGADRKSGAGRKIDEIHKKGPGRPRRSWPKKPKSSV